MATKPNRQLVWSGDSLITGERVVILATGFASASANAKTGGMVQTWIMLEDIAPHHAHSAGLDVTVCGDCPHRSKASGGTNACYVNLGQGPRSTWEAHRRNGSPDIDLAELQGRRVRFGSYGDPAAAPTWVWEELADAAEGRVTGYTHQWRQRPDLAQWCMASVDSAEEARQAVAAGWRPFFARPRGAGLPTGLSLVTCPASAEAGKRIQCAQCMRCGGNGNGRSGGVTIQAHGATAGRFAARQSLPLLVNA